MFRAWVRRLARALAAYEDAHRRLHPKPKRDEQWIELD